MRRKVVRTQKAPKPGGAYSQAIVAGKYVFTAGQGGSDPKTGKIPNGVEAQTRQALKNIKAVLEAAGTSLQNVVKVNVYLNDMSDFSTMNKVYLTFFPKDQPARTTLQGKLPGNILIEVDAVAIVPKS